MLRTYYINDSIFCQHCDKSIIHPLYSSDLQMLW